MQNDKIQLAAMGKHLAEQQQPMCLQKRVEHLEALLRDARDMMDNQTRGFSGMMRRIDDALECVTAAQPPVPEGWKLVPVEPTIDMLHVVIGHGHFSSIHPEMASKYYRAMLAAAPSPDNAK